MSKRRKRKNQSQPDLPEATLARARREAGLAADETYELEEVAAPEKPKLEPTRQESLPPAQKRKRRREVEPEDLSYEDIVERLTNPTKFVTEEQLRAQYTYVLADLRGMAMLAGLLFVIMMVVARFL
jgi:hypothetical protein